MQAQHYQCPATGSNPEVCRHICDVERTRAAIDMTEVSSSVVYAYVYAEMV